MRKEQWAPIKGYEGLYEVSTNGRVRSVDRIVIRKTDGAQCHRKGVVLGLRQTPGFYPVVCLCKNGKTKNSLVHRLVAQAFVPNPNNFPQVNHKDGDKKNCVVDNLEWVTVSDNVQHAIKTGLRNDSWRRKPVVCVETGEEFASVSIAAEKSRNSSNYGSKLVAACKERWRLFDDKHWKYKEQEGKIMRVNLVLDDFPMRLFEQFKKDLAKYVEAHTQVGGENTVFVNFSTDDIAKAQCGLIICDKYRYGDALEPEDKLLLP